MEDCHNETDMKRIFKLTDILNGYFAPVFKLTEIAQLYKTRLEQLGVEG